MRFRPNIGGQGGLFNLEKIEAQKLEYVPPRLAVIGTVKELTMKGTKNGDGGAFKS
jgi:hypothetical protein